jgi:hypothetical protein
MEFIFRSVFDQTVFGDLHLTCQKKSRSYNSHLGSS